MGEIHFQRRNSIKQSKILKNMNRKIVMIWRKWTDLLSTITACVIELKFFLYRYVEILFVFHCWKPSRFGFYSLMISVYCYSHPNFSVLMILLLNLFVAFLFLSWVGRFLNIYCSVFYFFAGNLVRYTDFISERNFFSNEMFHRLS